MAVSATTNSLRASTGSTGNVLVPDLASWGSTSSFSRSSWITLCQYLTGTSVTSSNWRSTLIEYAASSPNASDFRAVTYGTEKTAGQDVRVTFGGFTWYVMYLSLNSKGNPVITLWLDNYPQNISDGQEDYSKELDSWWTNGYIFCNLNEGMIRADAEGGFSDAGNYNYVNDMDNYLQHTVNDSSWCFFVPGKSVKFAVNGLFRQYCIESYYMPWQEYESAKEILGLPYDLPNEAWSSSLPDENFYSPDYNYSQYASDDEYNCQAWAYPATSSLYANFKLFIPSLSEIGYSGVSGLWGASTEQRSCNLGGEIGSYTYYDNEYKMSGTTWTRSGNYKQSYGYYFIKNSGDGKGVGATYARILRPCVHLVIPVV